MKEARIQKIKLNRLLSQGLWKYQVSMSKHRRVSSFKINFVLNFVEKLLHKVMKWKERFYFRTNCFIPCRGKFVSWRGWLNNTHTVITLTAKEWLPFAYSKGVHGHTYNTLFSFRSASWHNTFPLIDTSTLLSAPFLSSRWKTRNLDKKCLGVNYSWEFCSGSSDNISNTVFYQYDSC